MAQSPQAVEVFCSYAQEDTAYRQRFETHLSALKRQGLIKLWHDQKLLPGSQRSDTIDLNMERASVIVLLISANFIASDYCYGLEMTRALERHKANQARVIPIVACPCDWQLLPLASLQVLPLNRQPVSQWSSEDDAWTQVVAGLRRVIEDLSLLSDSAPRSSLPPIWMIPHPRNPFFLGNDELLYQIYRQFRTSQRNALARPQAISGLGGIGKTQVAVEYAYRYAREYQKVLWAYAESIETLNSSYAQLATRLNLPVKEDQKQEVLIQMVKTWLQEHGGWLLILDNADELALLKDYLPPVLGGHLLITTRASATGRLARRIEVKAFSKEQGAEFLLRRAALAQASEQDQRVARAITQELGGLPLALDQAGAYLEQTGAGLSEYLRIYQDQRQRPYLLGKWRELVDDHPQPVATTWSLSFANVERQNPVAADVLRLCAFLSADDIPLALLTEGRKPVVQNIVVLHQALETLRAYSLINYDAATQTLSLHRLVQVITLDALPKQLQQAWMLRAVTSVADTFPDPRDVSQWGACEKWLPHALMCAGWIEQEQLESIEGALLLNQTGHYLDGRQRYHEASRLYERALTIRALSLNNLIILYEKQGRGEEAEGLHKRMLAISEKQLGEEHSKTQKVVDRETSRNNLDYEKQGSYGEPERLYKQALAIYEKQLGGEHPDTVQILNNLAGLYEK